MNHSYPPSTSVRNTVSSFPYDPTTLSSIVYSKDFNALHQLGGTESLLQGLNTSEDGLRCLLEGRTDSDPSVAEEFALRRRHFGCLAVIKCGVSVYASVFSDYPLLCLFFIGICLLGCSLWAFSTKSATGTGMTSIQGALLPSLCTIGAGLLHAGLSVFTSWTRETQMRSIEELPYFTVIRNSHKVQISRQEIVVGDVIVLLPGDLVPFDGLFIRGHGMKCDETALPGGRDGARKLSFEACQTLRHAQQGDDEDQEDCDCFLLSGSRVVNGTCTYVILSLQLRESTRRLWCPVHQAQVDQLASQTSAWAFLIGTLLTIAIFIRFLVEVPASLSPSGVVRYLSYLLLPIIMVIMGSPAGLPLVIADPVSHVASFLLNEGIRIHDPTSLDTLACTTVVLVNENTPLFSDTGRVTDASIRTRMVFSAPDAEEVGCVVDSLPPALAALFEEAVTLASTYSKPILDFARRIGFNSPPHVPKVVYEVPCTRDRPVAIFVVHSNNSFRLFAIGPANLLVNKCILQVMTQPEQYPLAHVVPVEPISTVDIQVDLSGHASPDSTGMILALCYKDMDRWPVAAMLPKQADDLVTLEDLTFIGTMVVQGLVNPLGSPSAAKLRRAGVSIKLSTTHAVCDPQAHTTDTRGEPAQGIRGSEFRSLPLHQRLSIASHLDVLSNASSDDVQLLACDLMSLDHVVCVAGDTKFVNDAHVSVSSCLRPFPADVTADLSSLDTLILWSRHVKDVARQLLQYQIISGITSVALICVTPGLVVMSPFHFMWANLVFDASSFGLSHSQPLSSLWNSPPDAPSSPLFSTQMIQQVAVQSCLQVTAVTLVRVYGFKIVGAEETEGSDVILLQTLAFNTLIFCLLFNAVNCRTTRFRVNVLEGISREFKLIFILSAGAGFQVILIQCIRPMDLVVPLNARGWCASIFLGMSVIPLGAITRKLPRTTWALRILGALSPQGPPLPLVAPANARSGPLAQPIHADPPPRRSERYLFFLDDFSTPSSGHIPFDPSQSTTLFPDTHFGSRQFGSTDELTISSVSSSSTPSQNQFDGPQYIDEVPSMADDQALDPLDPYASLGDRLAELIHCLRNSPMDVSVSLDSILSQAPELMTASQTTPEWVMASSPFQPNSASSTQFYSIDAGSAVSTAASVLHESFTSDGTFYTAEDYPMAGPPPRSVPLAGSSYLATVLAENREVQINLINIHIYGDTYNGAIHGGNVGGRGSHATVFDDRVQLDEIIQIINRNPPPQQ